jgi:hypothetical protein
MNYCSKLALFHKIKKYYLYIKRFKNLSCARHNTTYKIMACTSCSTSDGGAPKGCKIMGLAAPIAAIN